MVTKRQAPYRHYDGTGCWTLHCSKRLTSQQAAQIMENARTDMVSVNLTALLEEFKTGIPQPRTEEQLAAEQKFETWKKIYFQILLKEQEIKQKKQPAAGQTILERDDPEFLEVLHSKGY